MIMLSKKQVKGLLNVINSKDTKHRPILQTIGITERNGKVTLAVTDSYQMHTISFAEEGLPNVSEELLEAYKANKLVISNKAINDWYKLATAKSLLSEEDLLNMASVFGGAYPDITRLVGMRETVAIEKNMFNSQYLLNAETITGEFVELNFHGDYKPISYQTGNYEGIILPMRKNK